MKSEASALLRQVEGASRISDGAAAVAVRGRIGDRPVQVAVCGVGERAARRAAERCVRLASRGACGRVVWIGIAGALSPDLDVGDLVVGRTVTAPDRPSLERVSAPGGGFPLGPVVRGALMRPSALVPLVKIRLRTARLGVRLAEVAVALA